MGIACTHYEHAFLISNAVVIGAGLAGLRTLALLTGHPRDTCRHSLGELTHGAGYSITVYNDTFLCAVQYLAFTPGI